MKNHSWLHPFARRPVYVHTSDCISLQRVPRSNALHVVRVPRLQRLEVREVVGVAVIGREPGAVDRRRRHQRRGRRQDVFYRRLLLCRNRHGEVLVHHLDALDPRDLLPERRELLGGHDDIRKGASLLQRLPRVQVELLHDAGDSRGVAFVVADGHAEYAVAIVRDLAGFVCGGAGQGAERSGEAEGSGQPHLVGW